MRARLPAFLVALVLLIAAAAPAAGQWRELYNQGREAFEAGRWGEAVETLEAAIAERGEERAGGGLIAGRRYTPRYYLGAALAELGRCRKAVQIFAEAETQGAIQKTPEHPDLVRRKTACEERLRRLRAALAAARSAVGEAETAAREFAPFKRSPTLSAIWNEGEGSLGSLEDQALQLMRQATSKLQNGERSDDARLADSARELATRSAAIYRDAIAAARGRLSAINQATASAIETLESVEAGARRTLSSVADLAPYPRRLGERVASLEALLERAVERKGTARSKELVALTLELEETTNAVREAARRPPSPLIDAAERYLAGDYEGVFAALADQKLGEKRARAHGCLLRAAAAFALLDLDGGEAGGEEATAPPESPEPPPEPPAARLAAAVDECRELDPPPPDQRFFSPRFIAYLERALDTTPSS